MPHLVIHPDLLKQLSEDPYEIYISPDHTHAVTVQEGHVHVFIDDFSFIKDSSDINRYIAEHLPPSK